MKNGQESMKPTIIDNLLQSKYSDLILLCTLLLAFIMLIIASTVTAPASP